MNNFSICSNFRNMIIVMEFFPIISRQINVPITIYQRCIRSSELICYNYINNNNNNNNVFKISHGELLIYSLKEFFFLFYFLAQSSCEVGISRSRSRNSCTMRRIKEGGESNVPQKIENRSPQNN